MRWHWHNLGHLRRRVRVPVTSEGSWWRTDTHETVHSNVERNQHGMRLWVQRSPYLQGEGVNHLAELIRLGIERGRAVEETPTAEHHPARLQLLVSTVHKPPTQTNKPLSHSSLNRSLRACFFGSNNGCVGQLQPQEHRAPPSNEPV